MDGEQLAALIFFAGDASVTPGPNNTIAAVSGASFTHGLMPVEPCDHKGGETERETSR